jgi:hypothetical protein
VVLARDLIPLSPLVTGPRATQQRAFDERPVALALRLRLDAAGLGVHFMRNLLFALLGASMLAGCATAPPPMAWIRTDGQRAAGDPVLAQQFDVDRTVCLGERQKAALSGVTVANGGFAAAIAAQDRGNSADAVAKGCMAEKGYFMVPEDQAEERRAEMAVVAEEKRKKEMAAAAPPPKPKMPAPKPVAPPATQ